MSEIDKKILLGLLALVLAIVGIVWGVIVFRECVATGNSWLYCVMLVG